MPHKWRTDGQHSNEYCAHCSESRPAGAGDEDEGPCPRAPREAESLPIREPLSDEQRALIRAAKESGK